jgi:aryl-alcohol dehydrogenase-like predicted oxidoreductase
VTWDNNKNVRVDNSPETTARMLDQSLKDLGSTYIDLYLIHWPDSKVDIRRPIEVLSRAKEAGKIRAIGLSNTNPSDLAKAMEIEHVDVLQSEFNLFVNAPKQDLFEAVRENKMGFMSWGTLDKGILTGRVTKMREDQGFGGDDVRSRAAWWTQADRHPKYQAMEKITPVLDAAGHSGLELAIGYVLQHDEVSTALCGSRTSAQLDSTLSALENLPPQVLIAEAVALAKQAMSD